MLAACEHGRYVRAALTEMAADFQEMAKSLEQRAINVDDR
jgi:hypothetical protein